MCCSGGGTAGGIGMTRCGLLCGMAALAALTAALFGQAWLNTEEILPYQPHSNLVSVKFRIGLFKACSNIYKHPNVTIYIQKPECKRIPYKSLVQEDVTARDLGYDYHLEFAPLIISKMRISTPFQVAAAVLILAGTISALIGHCCSDHRSLVACGLFLLGGLSLGGGLITLASALSEIYWEVPQKYPSLPSSLDTAGNGNGVSGKTTEDKPPLPRYWYGWCLQLSGLALILSEIAALLTISGYMARFPTVEDMVRVMVPGAERKLREQCGISSEYLVRTHQKSPGSTPCSGVNQPTKGPGPPRLTEEGTSLLCKTAPDICASNPQSTISYVDKADLSHMLPAYPETKIIDPSVVDSRLSGFVDKEGLIMDSRMLSETRQNVIAFAEGKEAACQEPPVCFSDFPPPPSIPTDQSQLQQGTPVQQQPPLAFADKEVPVLTAEQQQVVDSLLDAPYGYDTRYNSLAGQTVPITLKHHHQPGGGNSPQYVYQNFGTIHSGMLRVAEPGTSSTTTATTTANSNCTVSQRSMTLQNPKKKAQATAQIAQNAFSTLECERRRRGGAGGGGNSHPAVTATGKANFCAGSAV